MNRDDVTWRGYWPACPTPFHRDGSYDPESHRALLELLSRDGRARRPDQRDDGRVVLADARRAPAGRRDRDRPGRRPGAGRRRLRRVHGPRGGRARPSRDRGRAPRASSRPPPPYAKTYDDETVAYYEDLASGVDGPLLVYNWPHGTAIDIGPELASRLVEIDTVVALKDSTPNARAVLRDDEGRRRPRQGLRAVHVRRGLRAPARGRRRRLHRRRLASSAPPDPQFWEAYWRGDHDACRAHAVRVDRLFPKLWLPGGWGGVYAAYQSQLKAIMAMIGQPGGWPRRPAPAADRSRRASPRSAQILAEESLLPEEASVA